MQNRKFILFLIQITLTIFCLKAQDSGSTVIPENTIVLQHRFKDNALYIRWGVTDKSVWKYGNEYGYIIERTTLTVNGEKPTKIILTGKPIKPKPFLEWEQLAKENDMAAVVAQALYGDDFNVNDNTNNKVMQVINESSELQQRFGFSMFAVDQNFKVAQFAGLGFIDDDIDASKRYLYKIKMAVPEELLKIKEEGFIADPSIKKPLPKPYDFAGYYYNDAFVLIWEYDALRNFYNAYDLEKSEDGITFTKINKVPITKLADTEVSGISYTDIISQYEKEYWYRIIGKTIFDESSPLSDTISVIAHKALLVAPELRENEIVSDKEVVLKWNFAQDEAWKLTGFDILRANNAIGPYIEIKKDLSPEERMYRYSELQDINYFKIRAKGIAEDYQDSSPNMVQPIDSVPPSQPTGLIGSIDTLGVVRLSWRKNLELDLKGYSVLKANRPNKEYTRLNKAEISGIAYIDTVNLKTFNEKVFYKIVALDNR